MRTIRSLLSASAIVAAAGCATVPPAAVHTPAEHSAMAAPAAHRGHVVTPNEIDAHVRFLSSDLLEGRAPATRGGRLASEYVAAQFQALGLQPAGTNGTYFQPVALVGMTPEPAFSWGKSGSPTETLAYRDAFVAWAERPEADITADGEVVFVGYG